MITLLKTAERVDPLKHINNYVLSRHLFSYFFAKKYIGKIVLELGCGEGYGMNMLSPDCLLYTAIDKMVPKNLALNTNTALFKSNLPHLKNIGDNAYDTVLCFQVIEHIRNDKKLLSEIKRVLKPGGTLLLTTPNIKMSITKNPYHVREYDYSLINHLIAEEFQTFNVQGIFGNDRVMQYYLQNKISVEKILRWDIFNLHKLPSWLVKMPYNIMNNTNRLLLQYKQEHIGTSINHTDFYADVPSTECLDFFVIAQKNQ